MGGTGPRDGQCVESGGIQNCSSGLLGPRAPHLDGQDKCGAPALGLEGPTGRWDSTPLDSSEERGLYGVGGLVGVCTKLLFLSSLTAQACETPGICP